MDAALLIRRGAPFALLSLLMLAGPIWHQLLGQPAIANLRTWRMYYGSSVDVCDVRYVQLKGHERIDLDRYAILNQNPWYQAPAELRKLPNLKVLARVGRDLCDHLGRRPDVRATARCAKVQGWRSVMDEERNLCKLSDADIEALRPALDRR